MDSPRARLEAEMEGDRCVIAAHGAWEVEQAETLERQVAQTVAEIGRHGSLRHARIDLAGIESIDATGAWFLHLVRRALTRRDIEPEVVGAHTAHAAMIDRVEGVAGDVHRVAHRAPGSLGAALARLGGAALGFVARIGGGVIGFGRKARELIGFFGLTVFAIGRVLTFRSRMPLTSMVHHMEQVGVNALPIVGLLAFLIGVVLAFQGADQLARFGAEVFTVNLLGVSVLRELGILVTAIVIAGRSGSAFTAQIGTMKVNEEVAAMQTLGLDPIDVLVLPRIFALVITLPLLTFYADVVGLAGGAVMATLVLDISFSQFILQLDGAVSLGTYLVGIVKAPVFAYLIAMVGCFEGLQVSGSAESVGRLTTQSVVEAIFLVITFDAIFSILFSYMGI